MCNLVGETLTLHNMLLNANSRTVLNKYETKETKEKSSNEERSE